MAKPNTTPKVVDPGIPSSIGDVYGEEATKLQHAYAPTAAVVKPPVYDVSDVGTGFEDFTSDDMAVPFIGILQKGSPQVEEENPKYIPGAKAGSLYNNVTSTVFDGKTGITVIPVHRTRSYIEWIPKDDGGGLVAVYAPDDPTVQAILRKPGAQKFGKHEIHDNNELVETFSVFCLMITPTGFDRVVISFASSQIGMYKRWMTMAQSVQLPGPDGRTITPPMFAHTYRLTTAFFQKKENTWYKWAVRFNQETAEASRLAPDDALYVEAKDFRALVLRGAATPNYQGMENHEGGTSGEPSNYDM